MTRKDKKNRTCEHCGYICATPQKLHEHFNRKNPCRPRTDTSIQVPVQEPVQTMGSRLQKRLKKVIYEDYPQPQNLFQCKHLYDQLLQVDPEAYISETSLTKEEHKFEREFFDKEFERLSMITGDNEKSIIFREQNIGPALKRRAVVVHNAKVSKYHPDNGSDIRKILENQRKPFRELLEKEFDKRDQFKFSLCSLTKFLIDNKPDNKEKDKKKNSRTDWLRNKQIIVYNRAEIDDYLSNAFEQIIYQVEERGGKTNA
ncbi:36010_t:CDS:2 [Gigaspora margarita]|uniref:36010_t:CDS:1 n=1 Tax=Gigaspora margarita TaxID=4874 RepID=A0ABN7VD93_GIGMA|nr:36010_t:CDS:2 [Gigaspora margarita]